MAPRVLLFVFRNDLRLTDHPGIHALASSHFTQNFTHFLPLYIFSPRQIEVSGLLKDKDAKSPYPPARSGTGHFWRTGTHRVKFLVDGLFDMHKQLKALDSKLLLRVGDMDEVVKQVIDETSKSEGGGQIKGIWLSKNFGSEECKDEEAIKKVANENHVQFKVWDDNLLINLCVILEDLPFKQDKVSDVFTKFRQSVEPLRDNIRKPFEAPSKLPPLPPHFPTQGEPFAFPDNKKEMKEKLVAPLSDIGIPMPSWPKGAESAHPFDGGETTGQERVNSLLATGAMTAYKDTRNEMLGTEFSSKLSAWLAYGFLTPVWINSRMVAFEDGTDNTLAGGQGYAKGENKGTAAMRFELLWRDYMRLCMIRYKHKLYSMYGYRGDHNMQTWKSRDEAKDAFYRWQIGTTGCGLVDASQRELVLTGYTSNRARQNVASYLAKRLYIDWRLGAEWYEQNLVDYDVASNWGNWQYNAGVGNDPRGESRVFNQDKQSHDYDPEGKYIKTWVQELRDVDQISGVFQAWKLDDDDKKKAGGVALEEPLIRIAGGGGGRGGRGGKRGGGGGGPSPGHNRGGRGGRNNHAGHRGQ